MQSIIGHVNTIAVASDTVAKKSVEQMKETNRLIENIKDIADATHTMAALLLTTYSPKISVQLTMSSSFSANQETEFVFFPSEWESQGRRSTFYITVMNTGNNWLDTLEVTFVVYGQNRKFNADSAQVDFMIGLLPEKKSNKIDISENIMALMRSYKQKYPQLMTSDRIKLHLTIGDAAVKILGKRLRILHETQFSTNRFSIR